MLRSEDNLEPWRRRLATIKRVSYTRHDEVINSHEFKAQQHVGQRVSCTSELIKESMSC